MDALMVIRSEYKNFSKGNKKIADFILSNPVSVLSLTATDIAEKSHTSPASVIRFAKLIGFEGLDDFKLNIAAQQGNKSENVVDSIVSPDDTIEKLSHKVVALIDTTVQDMLHTLDMNQLSKAVVALKKANKVFCMGIGASSLTAYNIYHKFNRAGKQAIFNFDAHMSIEFIHYATKNDVIIAVSYSGLTKEVFIACEEARKNGAHIIFITKNNSDKIKNLSDEVLLVPDNEHIVRIGAISSITSSMAVGDILFLGAIQDELETTIEEKMIETNRAVNKLKEE